MGRLAALLGRVARGAGVSEPVQSLDWVTAEQVKHAQNEIADAVIAWCHGNVEAEAAGTPAPDLELPEHARALILKAQAQATPRERAQAAEAEADSAGWLREQFAKIRSAKARALQQEREQARVAKQTPVEGPWVAQEPPKVDEGQTLPPEPPQKPAVTWHKHLSDRGTVHRPDQDAIRRLWGEQGRASHYHVKGDGTAERWPQ